MNKSVQIIKQGTLVRNNPNIREKSISELELNEVYLIEDIDFNNDEYNWVKLKGKGWIAIDCCKTS